MRFFFCVCVGIVVPLIEVNTRLQITVSLSRTLIIALVAEIHGVYMYICVFWGRYGWRGDRLMQGQTLL